MNCKKEHENNKKISKKSIVVLILVVIVIAVLGIVLYSIDKSGTVPADKKNSVVETIKVGDKNYKPKKSIETYLFMGVDSKDKITENIEEPGQCDMLMLLVRDTSDDSFITLPINRNTITDVDTLDDNGKVLATTPVQIALAHANGEGKELSCKNTVNAVSKLLGGHEIDGYIAVNMGAIPTINHLAGGVTVKIEDDFSKSDASLKKGEKVHLTDEQAEHYIHDRINVGKGLNDSRMRRQSTYVNALKPVMKEKIKADGKFANTIYESINDYMVTNIDKGRFAKIALLLANDKDSGEIKITGKEDLDELGWEEFIPDENSVKDAITQLFYKRCD